MAQLSDDLFPGVPESEIEAEHPSEVGIMNENSDPNARIPISEFVEATESMRGFATCTPVLESVEVNKRLGCRLLLKAENQQRSGSFKVRGAYHCLKQLGPDERRLGVISYSSGNHAIGLALAAQQLGTSALIVAPDDASKLKISRIKALGASVVHYKRDIESAQQVIAQLERHTGRIHTPPSGNWPVTIGAGSVAVELLNEKSLQHAIPDTLLVPCGGGGLAAATALVCQELAPSSRVFSVEPEQFDDTRQSLQQQQIVSNSPGGSTICDSIMTPCPNPFTFAINQKLLCGGFVVADKHVKLAMRVLFEDFKTVAEPGGAIGLAAVLASPETFFGRVVVVFLTGGNISRERFFRLTGEASGGP